MLTGLALFLVAALLAIAVLAAATVNRRGAPAAIYAAIAMVSLGLLAIALARLFGGEPPGETVVLPLGLPWSGAHFRIDALAAFFLAVVDLGAAIASFYGIGYGRHEAFTGRVMPFYAAFIAGMNLVILADDAFTFLLAWEFMSLTSWALVMAHHRNEENLRAGYVYIVMASAGTLALLLAFGLLAGPHGGYDFAAMRAAHLTPGLAALALGLVILGAGSKAGLVPLHVWLPLAHPAAPSHVSALMSGVMTKVAVYAFIRIVFDLIGPPAWWWSLVVLTLGGITAVIGILQAIMQDDLKKVLAYSTVENIGVIFVGLGLALAFKTNAMPAVAALAMTAALFHVLNHSLFKSLLFFGAGAVQTATGTRTIERMGGLIHRMPATAFAFLAGAVAISALPPLNGFVSEWLTFQAILVSPVLPEWSLKIATPAVGALLALSAALAAACFVRAYGVAFLGRPRTPAAANAREVDAFSLAAMLGLVALCLAAGIFPGFVIDALSPVTTLLVGDRMPAQGTVAWLSIVPLAAGRSSYNGLLVFLFITVATAATVLVSRWLGARAVRRAAAWDGGFPEASPATQYTGASFAQPIRRVYGTSIFQAREEVDFAPPASLRPARIVVTVRDLVWEELYLPVAGAVLIVADRLNRFQFLTIRQYLSLVFITLVALLAVIAL